MKTSWSILAFVVTTLGLAACSGTPTRVAQGGAIWERIPVGQNLANETCWAATGTMAYEAADVTADRVFNVQCGDWEWPSARVFQIENGTDNLFDFVADNPWLNALGERMLCVFDSETTIIDEVPALLLDCRLNNGGWPYMALITHMDGTTYLADGIPAALPPVENAIAAAAGRPLDADVGRVSPAARYLQSRLGERLYSAGELEGYYRAMLLGQYYNGTKAFRKAEREYWKALALHEKALGADNLDTAGPLMHIALELSNQEQFARADALFRRARNKIDPGINVAQHGRYVSYYALHAANQGHFETARRLAHEATEIRRVLAASLDPPADTAEMALSAQHGSEGLLSLESEVANAVEVAHSLYIEAAMLEREGAADVGDKKLGQAQLIVQVSVDAPPLWEPQMLSLDAHIEDARLETEQADAARRSALELFEERAPGERPTALSLLETGNALVQEQRPDEALAYFRLAARLAAGRSDSFRGGQLAPYLSTLLAATREHPEWRDALYGEFFEVAQLVRSGVTAKDIARTVARFAERDDAVGNIMSELQKSEFARVKYQQEYQAELGRFLEEGHHERLADIQKKLQGVYDEIGVLSQQIQAASPRYKQLIGAAISGDDVMAALRPGEALLQVVVGDSRSFVIVVKPGGVFAREAEVPAADIAAVVDRIRARIEQTRGVALTSTGASLPDASFIRSAYELYARLVGPLDAELADASSLVTVASGPLLSFPFGLFVTAPPPDADVSRASYFKEVDWLARRSSISLVPSAQSFVYLRDRAARSSASKPIVAFGGYVSDAGGDEVRGISLPLCALAKNVSRYYFANLPGTVDEIEALTRTFPNADTYLGAEFTERAVKEASLDEYRIVYFATHALLPDELECRSEPSLLASRPGSDEEDGFLTSDEILQLQLNADLVVLSACNTGGADKARGESLSGLARAFFFAGARSLLVSHWSLPDEATAELMQAVFHKLDNGEVRGVAEALRLAQLEMLDRPAESGWSHPFYWAGFSLVGDGAQTLAGLRNDTYDASLPSVLSAK